jgi:hypothetical protein
MKSIALESKLLDIQGLKPTEFEKSKLLSAIKEILLRSSIGEIDATDAATKLRSLCLEVADDLRINGLHINSTNNVSLIKELNDLFNFDPHKVGNSRRN